jgi:endo-1,4-beta-mannosidase
MTQPFVLGVNYWPRTKAMYWWRDFDADEVRQEFATLADIGMNIVRIFLLWDDWQPTPDSVSQDCMGYLGQVCDIAHEHGLQLDVTFFTGHMSGPNWAPRWLLAEGDDHPSHAVQQVVSDGEIVGGTYRNMYHDDVALEAERLLLKTVVSAYKDHPAIWMWNLGNEPDLFAQPHTPESATLWVREMRALIKAIDPVHDVTCGLHMDSVVMDNNFHIPAIYAETDVAVMHGYPMYTPWARHALDPDFMPFACALVSAMSGKPCLAEEWGGCTNPDGDESVMWEWTTYNGRERDQFMAGETAFAEYVALVLPKLVEAGSTGALLWCWADYSEDLWDKPPCDEHGAKHERHFGLVRPDGSLKPHAEAIRAFAQTKPTVQPAKRIVDFDITPAEYYADPSAHAERFYRAYLAQYEGDAT